MTDVVLSALKRTHTSMETRNDHQGGVEYRDTQHHHRHEQLCPLRLVDTQLQPQVRDEESEIEASGVSHVDGGGIEIAAQKTEGASGKPDAQHRGEGLLVQHGNDEERCSCDSRYAGGEPINVVEQVHRIRDANEPHQRDDRVDAVVQG